MSIEKAYLAVCFAFDVSSAVENSCHARSVHFRYKKVGSARQML